MPAMSTDDQQKIHDLRTRILKKETVTPEELRDAITLLRQTRAARAVSAATDAASLKKPKAAPMSLDDLNALFEQVGQKKKAP